MSSPRTTLRSSGLLATPWAALFLRTSSKSELGKASELTVAKLPAGTLATAGGVCACALKKDVSDKTETTEKARKFMAKFISIMAKIKTKNEV